MNAGRPKGKQGDPDPGEDRDERGPCFRVEAVFCQTVLNGFSA